MKHATKKLLVRSMIATVLICALTVAGIAVYASESTFRVEGDPLVYMVWGDKVYVTDCDPGYTSITIPGTVNGYPVTVISWAFDDYDTLETLTFADDSKVHTIHNSFDGCDNLTTINWGESGSLKVIDNAFDYCIGLEELTIPSSVQTIENWSFENCLNLKKLTFEEGSQLTKIGKCAFRYDLDDDTIVPATITSLTLPASLEELGAGAFNYVPVEHFALEDGSKLKAIPNGFLAAEGADGQPGVITSPTILEAIDRLVRKAPEAAAKACASLVSIDLGENNSLIWIGDGAFKNQIYLTDINLGESVREEGLTIEEGAFVAAGNSAGIETLVLPANLTEIGERAFIHARIENLVFSDNCKLTEIPDGFMAIHGIGNNGRPGETRDYTTNTNVFVNDPVQIAANSLKTVDFGENNSLTRIGRGAFYNQSHMTSIDFGTSEAALTFDWGAFIGVGNNGYLFENEIDAELHEGIETLVFPANLIEMGYGSFDDARIKNIVFSDNCKLTEIPYSFMGLDNYGSNGRPGEYKESYSAPAEFITSWAQIAANSLETVDFGENNSLTRIGEGSFKNQSHMTAIDFGTAAEGVDLTIGYGVFIGAGNNGFLYQNEIDAELHDGIQTVVFPANLIQIGVGSFDEACIKNIVFSDNCKLSTIPDAFMGLTQYGNNAHPGQTLDSGNKHAFVTDWVQIAANSLETVDFGENNSLTKIESGAFYNQSHLTSIDFGTGAEGVALSFGNGVFIGAGNNGYLYDMDIDEELNEGIDTLVFPAHLTSLGTAPFEAACIKNIIFSDNCKLTAIPDNFMGQINFGSNGHPGQKTVNYYYDTTLHMGVFEHEFVKDSAQILANSLETVDFGDNNSITSIGAAAFKNQSHMTAIDFGTAADGVKLTLWPGTFIGVGNNAYLVEQGIDEKLNDGIDTLVFPAHLKTMYVGSFESARIKNLVFSDNCLLTEIPSAFMQVAGENGTPSTEVVAAATNSLESVDFGANNSISTIGNGSFTNQTNLKSIDFGTNTALTDIGAGQFIGLKSLEKLDLSGTQVKAIHYGVFSFCGAAEIILPETLETLNHGAFQHLTEMTILVIDDSWSITELEGGVFSHSESLTKVDLLNSNITTIGDSLKDNANLTSVIFPAKLESIVWDNTEDDEVCPFYGCENVNRLYFASADPSGYTFTEGVFQFLSESGIVLVPDDTTDESIDAYKTLLTACGLSFEEGKWRIARQTLDTVEVTYEWNGAEGGVDSELFIAGDEFIAPVAPKYEGYNFDGWYADEALTVEWDMNSIITEDVTIYAKWSKKVTASVGGDNTESVVTPDVVIEDNKAALDVTDEEIQQIIENSKEDTTIIIDLSELDSDITAVEIPADLIEEITDSMNSEDTETEFLEIRTSDGSIVLDKTALETIADEIGEGMTVVLDEIDEDDLNEDQKAALEDMDVHGTYEASVSDSETEQSVTDLNGGKATLSVEFEIPEGYDADDFCVVSVGKDGQTETLTTWYENGKLYWEADSFSDFAIIYDEAIEDDEEEEQPEADSFDYELWLASVMMLRNQKFNIAAAATEGGSITSEGNTSVKYDMSITYTITPDEGYEISAVLVDGVDVGAVSEYTFKKVRAAHTISAIFTKID